MNFQEIESRYKKGLEFFNDPEISEGRKLLKLNEFKKIEGLFLSQKFYSEKLNLKFCFDDDFVLFEDGTEIYKKDAENMKCLSTSGLQSVYNVFKIFGKGCIFLNS
jgi:hypothetical protein